MNLQNPPPIPNLFIIGSMKSGTTSLHEYLNEHPEIFMSDIKEPGFFSDCANYYPNDEAWYRNLFSTVSTEKFIGESSTNYTKLPVCDGVVEALQAFNPDACLIYVMRHPIKRAISHYWHNVKKGHEYKDILSAVKPDSDYVNFSDYAFQLEPYVSVFGKEKLYTLVFEDLIENPGEEVKKIFNWLNVEEDIELVTLDKAFNALPDSFEKVTGNGMLYRFRNSLIWNMIAPLVPKKFTSFAAKLTVEETKKTNDEDDQLFELLTPMFQEKVRNLEQLLEKKFTAWDI